MVNKSKTAVDFGLVISTSLTSLDREVIVWNDYANV